MSLRNLVGHLVGNLVRKDSGLKIMGHVIGHVIGQ